ncbi:MAG: glycosyltransferase, partial [Verrucomicrobiaceae bacterium]
TDETVDVLKEFKHLRVLVEPDRGQCDAFNKGVAMARGEWILWLNADDFMLPGVMQAYLKEIQNHGGFDVLYGHMVFVNEMGDEIRTILQPKWNYWMMWFGVYGLPSTGTLYRADLLRKAPLDIDFHMIMDSEWNLRNGRDLRVHRLRRKSVAFRVTADNKTSGNIQTGGITPRHAHEREILNQRYPCYNAPSGSKSGKNIPIVQHVIRRVLRGQVLMDKGWSKFISLFQSHKSV